MKVLGFLFCFVSLFSFAQQGHVSYDVIINSDDPKTAPYLSQMEGSTMEMYFNPNFIRSEMYMGEFMTTTTFHERNNDSTLVLLDAMFGKVAMKSTFDDLPDEQQLAYVQLKVDVIEGEKMNIIGFECKKAVVTSADNTETIVWFTESVVPDFRTGQYLFEGIKGLPLLIETKMGNMNLTYKAFEFNKKIKKPSKLFDMSIPKGFEQKTPEEMKQMRMQR